MKGERTAGVLNTVGPGAAADLLNGGALATAVAGVGIDAVGPYRIGNPGPGGLIFGYATVGEQAIAEGIDRLARAIGELRPYL